MAYRLGQICSPTSPCFPSPKFGPRGLLRLAAGRLTGEKSGCTCFRRIMVALEVSLPLPPPLARSLPPPRRSARSLLPSTPPVPRPVRPARAPIARSHSQPLAAGAQSQPLGVRSRSPLRTGQCHQLPGRSPPAREQGAAQAAAARRGGARAGTRAGPGAGTPGSRRPGAGASSGASPEPGLGRSEAGESQAILQSAMPPRG